MLLARSHLLFLSCRLWMWAQHIALTVFMGFVLTYCVGTVLEMHARQSFVRTHRLEHLAWQPGVLPRLMMQALKHLIRIKSRLLELLGLQCKQQADTDAGKQGCPDEELESWKCTEVPGAVSTDAQDSNFVDSAKLCSQRARTAPKGTACCPSTHSHEEGPQSTFACGSDPASSCPVSNQHPGEAVQGQHAPASGCCPSADEAQMAHAHRDVSLAVGYQGRMCGHYDSSSSPESGSFVSGSDTVSNSDTDVSEAVEACCGVQGVQAQACQKLLNKGKVLDSQCRQLASRYANTAPLKCSTHAKAVHWHVMSRYRSYERYSCTF